MSELERPCDRGEDAGGQATLQALPPGLHHAAHAGYWVMVGRALPTAKLWSSLPPAPSLSLVWGSGGARIEHAHGVVELAYGQLLWMEAGFAHRGTGAVGSDFLTVFAPELCTAGPPGLRVGPIARSATRWLVDLAARLLGEAPIAAVDHAQLAALVTGLPSSADHRVAPGSLRRARRALEGGFAHGVSVHELATAAGWSLPHLSRRFHAMWGLPATQYRRQLQLSAATRLLLGGQTVTAAAAAAGFADGAHLSRTFRAQYGIPPSAWQDRVLGHARLPLASAARVDPPGANTADPIGVGATSMGARGMSSFEFH